MTPALQLRSGIPARNLRRFIPVAFACAILPLLNAQQTVTAAPAAPPQVITVQSPATQMTTTNGPDWSRANQGAAAARYRTEGRDTPTLPDAPTEFQTLVSQTVGMDVPIFGADLFSNRPSTFAPVDDAQVTSDYVIGTGDEIRISATGQLNQQGTFTVDRAGTITVPEVGTLSVAGIRFADLKSYLRQQLGRVYRNFELNVSLGQLRSIQIYVTGEVRQPGAYTVSSLASLINALFASGGVRPAGSLRRIQLLRDSRVVTEIDLYDLLLRGDKSKDVKLQPGDIIFVPKAGAQVAVIGSVTTPAIYELRNETTLQQLLDIAKGVTSTALGTTVRVESIANASQRTVSTVNLQTGGTTALHDGDIVSVQSISGQFKDAVTLRGNVTDPGRYAWHAGMRLSDLIPNRDMLVTRKYYSALNLLGQSSATAVPLQGHLSVSKSPTNGAATQAPVVNPGAATPPAAGIATTTSGTNTNGQDTPAATSNGDGGGTTVGDALTQNNGTFAQTNEVILSAPDVDLAYAVIERLDPKTLSTYLVPFNLAAVLDGTDPAQNLNLEPGDVVTIFSKADIRVPQSQQTRFVRLEGEVVGAGVYSVKPGETLRQLVARAGGLTPDAYLYASEFTRQSTRRVEQQRLREYADSLEAQINTQISQEVAGSLNPGSASQTANAAADTARAAVARIRRTQASGRIVLKLKPDSTGLDALPAIEMEDGDRFIVPRQPTSVAVAGEVYNASSFLFAPGLQARDYLRDAGGPQRTADGKRLFIIRADGSVVSRQYNNVEKATTLPGDTIVMPPQLTRRNLLRDVVSVAAAFGQVASTASILAILAR